MCEDPKENLKKEGVIINRMYVGDYLSQNLGHEVINLFQDDKGRHYLYLNQSGSLSSEHKDHDAMILVRYEGNNLFEVVGMAKGLHPADGITEKRAKDLSVDQKEICDKQIYYIEEEQGGIRYDGLSIFDIFGEEGQQNVYVTFRADVVKVPKDELRIFIEYNPEAEDREEDGRHFIVMRDHNLPKTSLKSYITPTVSDKENKVRFSSDCNKLMDRIVNNDSLWAVKTDWKVNPANDRNRRPVSLFDICEIQNDENRITNAMAYFMRQPEYRDLWKGFFNDVLDVKLTDNYLVEREKDISQMPVRKKSETEDETSKEEEKLSGRIDLYIKDENSIIVIENKIKSDINTNRTDKINESQLDRYKKFVERVDENNEYQHRYFILAPNYNKPHISDKMSRIYKKITYKDLYDYLNLPENKEIVEKDPNFAAFRDVIHRHTLTNPNGYLYYEMMEKFYSRIKELKSKQNES